MSGYEAKVMKHPLAMKGKAVPIKGVDADSGRQFTDHQGTPDIFPDVTVKDATAEAYFRAKGYLIPGEVPPPPAEYSEYPVMLSHPDHVDAVPDDWDVVKLESGEIQRTKILGKPEVLPPKQANNATEEAALESKGYHRAGHDNPEAVRASHAHPYVPGRVTQEWPKMVDGLMVDPNADAGGPMEYPKYVGETLVNNRAEEAAARAKIGQVMATVAPPAEKCIICGKPIDNEDYAKGAAGPFHSSHMSAAPASTDAKPAAPVTAPADYKPKSMGLTHGEKIKAGREAAKAKKLAEAAAGAHTQSE